MKPEIQPNSKTLILKAGVTYFALVFGVGFILGPIRVLWAVPRFGERLAELMEQPLMLIAIVVAARWIGRRFNVPPDWRSRLGVGFLALGLLLLFEVTIVRSLRGLSLAEYVQNRDPVSGTAYLLALLLFALMPWLISRWQPSEPVQDELSE